MFRTRGTFMVLHEQRRRGDVRRGRGGVWCGSRLPSPPSEYSCHSLAQLGIFSCFTLCCKRDCTFNKFSLIGRRGKIYDRYIKRGRKNHDASDSSPDGNMSDALLGNFSDFCLIFYNNNIKLMLTFCKHLSFPSM